MDAAHAWSQTAALAQIISLGHTFIPNLYRGHYELGLDIDLQHRIPQTLTELTHTI